MPNELPLVQIDLTPQYRKKPARIIKKDIANIRTDIQPIIEQIQAGDFCRKPHFRRG